MMEFHIGKVVKGEVTGIQAYGVFVDLGDHQQGLIHISECHFGYVKDIHDYLSIGQQIEVVVLDIDEYTGKISLSLRCLDDPKSPLSAKAEPMHKHYWTNKEVHDGFAPIAERRDEWKNEALSRFVK